jgi:hypothetical protein
MKALSVRSPWAEMIASGRKTLEIRSWRTSYRGPLLICQSGGGGAVAVVEVVNCRPGTSADYDACGGFDPSGSFAWELRLVRRVTSGTIKGKLSFYDVPESSFSERPD